MKYFIILSSLIIAACLIGCSESTTNPYLNTPDKLDLLTNKIWVFNNSDNGKTPEISKLFFLRDGTFQGFKDNKWENGTWSIDSGYVTLTTIFQTQTDTMTIQSLSENNLAVKGNIDSIQTLSTWIPEIHNSSPVKIEGSITFFPDVPNQDLSQAKVAMLWLSPQNEFQAIIWGIGTIDANNKTFSINVDNNVPMSLFMPNTDKIDGYMNIGFVVLLWDNSVQNGKIYNTSYQNDDFSAMQLGVLEDRSIIYINGDYKAWNIDYLIGDFNQGYTFCKGWYNTQQGQNDGWQASPVWDNQIIKVLKAGSGLKGFKFPNWS